MSTNETTSYSFVNLHLGTMASMCIVFGALFALGLFYKLYRLKTRAARDARDARRRALAGGYRVDMDMGMGMETIRPSREKNLQPVFPK
jgi:hypothetical protein